jgi:molecular chaperone Hsp33
MKDPDQLKRFLFTDSPIRGEHVSLDASWRKIVAQSDIKGRALTLLGHALTAATLLVETLKIEGSVSLQIRGTGAIHLLMAEATSSHTIRGIVRQSRELGEATNLQEIFESDKLVITIRSKTGSPHQGIVPLDGDNISDALQAYFDQSEQLPTRIWFSCDEQSASGLLLQKLPAEEKDKDAWNRVLHLAETTQQKELLELKAETLLHRLFHEETLEVFEAKPVEFSCTCSEQRTRDMLVSLGKSEIDNIIKEQNEVAITCEFCNSNYAFDRVDLEQLFVDGDKLPLSPTRH